MKITEDDVQELFISILAIIISCIVLNSMHEAKGSALTKSRKTNIMTNKNHLLSTGYIDPQETYDSPYLISAEVDENIGSKMSIEDLCAEQKTLLQECRLQLEYLNDKFGETGTTNQLLSKLKNYTND